MNMRLVAADLSLGRSFASSSTTMSKDPDTSRCLMQREQLNGSTHPMSCNSDLHALEVYHKALEDERLKIQAFERELPFCMQLLDDAIEASKEQLEERLTCKLNTPLHDEAPTHHEFVCKYTNSLTKGSESAPTMGEINLHFKHKWTCGLPTSSAPDVETAPSLIEPTRWMLQKTTSTAPIKEYMPASSKFLKLKECSTALSDGATSQQAVVKETDTLMISSSTKTMPNSCPSKLITNNAMQYLSTMQSIFSRSLSPDQKAAAPDLLDKGDDDTIKGPDEKRQCIQAMPASLMPINMPALINANLRSPNSYSRSIGCITAKLGPQELHINTHGLSSTPLAKSTSSSPGGNAINLQPGSVQRKPRRCWSPELHQRFLTALNRLGGCQVATPKQIRELMNVEGLTNDEVKSHLQKFRLHMRRPINGVVANSVQSNSPQTTGHHVLVLGHIWVPPEYDEQHQQYAVANLDNMHITSKDLPECDLYGDKREVKLGEIKSLSTNNTIESEDIEDGGISARAAGITIIDLTPAELDNNADKHSQHNMLTNMHNFSPQAANSTPIALSDTRAHDANTLPRAHYDQGNNIKQLLHLIQAKDDNISTTADADADLSHTNINLRERETVQPDKIADFKEFKQLTMVKCHIKRGHATNINRIAIAIASSLGGSR
ncbi:hypothetical protein GOP47_0012640 [Adiantum capillus-veneris]|uniref:HTH myb-type domain-containing protein n=1 Tax=Adiantum capillus-veneris TaxID=13818 RepID=A0A9D4ZEL4_ADICA|nr:hypothetical protein GOP47_0012640 [Adiantum capillus-veneris]